MPPRTITYSLRLAARNSDDYYQTIARFADDWLARALFVMRDLIAGFRAFRAQAPLPDRSEAECALELLALGVLLREHHGEAGRWPGWLARVAQRLVRAQTRWPRLESVIKHARGGLGWLARRVPVQSIDHHDVPRLLDWLRANGEAGQATRLAQWQDYLETSGARAAREIISRCLTLAADFEVASASALGQYTQGVERFLAESAPHYRWRYDAAFVSRSRLEYHLGMLATEILNRAYRERFRLTRQKIVVVPPCMRAQPDEKCKMIATPFGGQCQACTPTCRVHQITQLGKKRGFEVFVIPDAVRVFGAGMSSGEVGVAGISCALTNWSGGWETDEISLPAQGVLLDYVGCNYHWDDAGIVTDVNLKKLLEVVSDERRDA